MAKRYGETWECGHPLTAANTRSKHGGCRTCHLERCSGSIKTIRMVRPAPMFQPTSWHDTERDARAIETYRAEKERAAAKGVPVLRRRET
jgi:hypothetical protein